MNSAASPVADSRTAPPTAATGERFDRLVRTRTLAGSALALWRAARIVIAGVGAIGARLAVEIVRSGAQVLAVDPDVGAIENLGTQPVRAGVPKVDAVVAACDAIEPDRATGFRGDIRHVGVHTLRACDLIVDATDDAGLAPHLVAVSNGLGIPHLRAAVDGTGQGEFGRVAVALGTDSDPCQACSYDFADLGRESQATPCPAYAAPTSAATLAGGAIASAVTGVALLQAQRLLGGNGAALALGRELVLDLDHPQLLPISLERSARCLIDHARWSLTGLDRTADETTFGDLFELARSALGTERVALEPFGHALCLEAGCAPCGTRRGAVGSPWAVPPACDGCGQPMTWRPSPRWLRLNAPQARSLDILDRPLSALGMPPDGALLIARSRGAAPVRYLLAPSARVSPNPEGDEA